MTSKMASFEPVLIELFAPIQFDWYNASYMPPKKFVQRIVIVEKRRNDIFRHVRVAFYEFGFLYLLLDIFEQLLLG